MTDDRFAAALKWCGEVSEMRAAKVEESRMRAYKKMLAHNSSREKADDTVVYRISFEAMELAEQAWPDKKTRKTEISKLIVIAAREELKKTSSLHPAQ